MIIAISAVVKRGMIKEVKLYSFKAIDSEEAFYYHVDVAQV
jgi:hypothetical protein